MKNKRRRKGGSDSDLSDREMTPGGSGIDEDTLQLLQVVLKSYKAVWCDYEQKVVNKLNRIIKIVAVYFLKFFNKFGSNGSRHSYH